MALRASELHLCAISNLACSKDAFSERVRCSPHNHSVVFKSSSIFSERKQRRSVQTHVTYQEGTASSGETSVVSQLTGPCPKTDESSPASVSPSADAESEAASDSHPENAGEISDQSEVETEAEVEDTEVEPGYRMSRVCDRLIEVFLVERSKPEEWRKLLAFSEEWEKIRPHFFARCKSRAQETEDPEQKAAVSRLARKLKEVDASMVINNELFAQVKSHAEEIDGLVARRRKDFTSEFFDHLRLLCDVHHADPEKQQEIVTLAAKCVTAVDNFDRLMEDEERIQTAQTKFEDILAAPSLEAACNKIDELAAKNQLDSSLMLLMTKAWAASKESNMMKDEVKDVMYHLYMKSRANMQRMVPPEVRIVRHILALEDPRERFAALTAAFSPGAEIQGEEEDYLYTTPEELHRWVQLIIDTYYTSKGNSSLIQGAAKLMNPEVIKQLEILKDMIEAEFL